jgi:hypothetical protein
MIQYSTMLYRIEQYRTVRYSSAVQCSAEQYDIPVQYSAVQCSALSKMRIAQQ